MTPASERGTTPARLREAIDAVRPDGAALGFLSAMFIGRWMLADWNSYWLDELYSVALFGSWHPTALEALRDLAENSIHPPLYQFVLYQWMAVFSDSEVATRSLSNLYITLAALLVYLLIRDAWGRRLGFLSAVAFSVMYTPTYYALETRSYAQTMFLVSLSSYLLLRLLRDSPEGAEWRGPTAWIPAILLVGANTALLMTHYYNMFWLAAQAAFTVLYLVRELPRRRWFAGVGALVGAYGVPALLFWLTWGGVFTRQLDEFSSGYEIEGDRPTRNIVDLLIGMVFRDDIDPPTLVAWVLVAIVAGAVGWSIVAVVRRGEDRDLRSQPWSVLYLTCWLVLPLAIVYTGFTILGVERYSQRYFVFSVVPLAPLLIVSIDRVAAATRRWFGTPGPAAASTLLTLAVIIGLLLPGGHEAATRTKQDWRGIVHAVVEVMAQDEGNDYIIFETAFRRRAMTNYYFERFAGSRPVFDTVRPHEERRGGPWRIIDRHEEVIAEHDRLVLLLTHHRTDRFPGVLEELEARYDIERLQLDHTGRGFIVYRTH